MFTHSIQKNRHSFELHECSDIIDYDEHALVTLNAVDAILFHPTYALEATAHAAKSFQACPGFHGEVSIYTLRFLSRKTLPRISQRENREQVLYFSRRDSGYFS